MGDRLFEAVRDVLTFLAAIGGAWLTVRGSRRTAEISSRDSREANQHDQIQEDLAATREALWKREKDLDDLREKFDDLRETLEKRMTDLIARHERREQQLVTYIVSIGGTPPLPEPQSGK